MFPGPGYFHSEDGIEYNIYIWYILYVFISYINNLHIAMIRNSIIHFSIFYILISILGQNVLNIMNYELFSYYFS